MLWPIDCKPVGIWLLQLGFWVNPAKGVAAYEGVVESVFCMYCAVLIDDMGLIC